MEIRLKRFLSLILAIVMVIGMLPTNIVMAEENSDVQVEETTEPVTEPEETTEPATEPEETTEPVTEPEETTEPATEPEETTEPATEPEETTEPATEPEETTEPATEPEETTEPATEPEETTEPATEPEETTEPETEPEEKEPVEAEPIYTTVTVQIVPDVDLPDNGELFAYFAESKLYGYEPSTFGTTARTGLTANEQAIYDVLKARIESVALNGGSTEFVLPEFSGLKYSWTNTELGLESIEDKEHVSQAFSSQYNMTNIVAALLSDCPFDLYWYDKTVGARMTYQIGRSGVNYGTHTVWDEATITDLTFSFAVSADYQAGANLVTANVAKVTTAKNTAAQVVAEHADKSDYEKLVAYKDYICNVVSYDHAAADNEATPYGDPWQLISVFDGSNSTNVVCEGYAKAFQYLCDLSGLDCISVSGVMGGGTGEGDHMWNVVTLDGGKYLVDVTNTDTGSVGQDGELFLAGGTYENGCYSYACGGQTVYFACSDLGLAADGYTYEPPVTSYAVTVAPCENGMVTANPISAEAGTEIQLTVTPATNYILDTLTVTWGDNQIVEVTDNKFTIPAGDVTVVATFKKGISGTCGTNLTWTLDEAGTLTISGTGAMKDYDHNSGSPWYRYRTDVKKVVIQNGVTSIGNYAFYRCSSLTSVTIPDSVTSIGSDAFLHCSSLTSVTIGDGVTIIGDYAFYNCSSLTSVVIPAGVTIIGDYAFYNCSSLTSVVIPAGVTIIGDYAFYDCNLRSVTLSDSVTSIGAYAFYGCSLTSVTIPDSVTSIGSSAFDRCSSLTSVYIDDVAAWLNISFGNCYANPLYNTKNLYVDGKLVTDLVIPDGVTSVGDYAFYNCNNLTSVVIPDSVTSIGYDAFEYCYNLTSVYIDDATAWLNISFGSYSSNPLYNANNGYVYVDGKLLTELVIPASVTSIGDSVFVNCDSLRSVTIGDSVTSIGTAAFSGCDSLRSVTIGDSVTSIDYAAFSDCNNLTSVTIGDSETSIGMSAFSGCDSLTSVTIPDSVTSIDYAAFFGCDSLRSVTIGDGVTSIGGSAFENCSSLRSVTIGDGVTSIGGSAFKNCSSLTSVVIPDSVTSIDSYVFFGCNNLTSVVIPAGVTSIGSYAFSGCNNLTSVTIGDGVTSIGGSAFENCSSLRSVTIGDGVTSIGGSAFKNCSSLTSVVIPDSVTSIGSYAFYNCNNLTDVYIEDIAAWLNISFSGSFANPLYNAKNLYVDGELLTDLVIPDSVISIGSSALYNYSSLTSVTIPDSVTSIGSDAFYGCSSLMDVCIEDISAWLNISFGNYNANPLSANSKTKSLYVDGELLTNLVIPDGVTSIGSSAFRYCSGLTSVTIPNSVVSIGSSAFSGCTALTAVYYGADAEHWNALGSNVPTAQYIHYSCTNPEGHWKHIEVDVTCETDGYTCDACSCGYERNKVITQTALGHKEVIDKEASNPTCTEPGKTQSSHCETCGKVLAEQTETEAPLGHYVVRSSSELVDSYTVQNDSTYPFASSSGWYTSSNKANNSTSTFRINALYDCTLVLGYKVSSEVNYDKLTVSANSITKDTISGNISEKSLTMSLKAGDIVKITYSKDSSQSSGSDAGYFRIVSCTQTTIGSVEYIPTDDLEPTCEEDVVCDSCKQVMKPKLGHTEVIDPAVAVTCTTNGLTEGKHCSTCGKVFVEQTVIVSQGHDYVDFVCTVCALPEGMAISTSDGAVTITGYTAPSDFAGTLRIPAAINGVPVTAIGSSAFKNCSSLTSVVIPDSVTSIGGSAFSGCSSLTSVTIGDGVKSIGLSAFYGCSSLTSVTISDSVTSIGTNAFKNCSRLKSIYIPASVTTISASSYSYSPFYGCSSSLKIYCEAATKPSGWGSYWNYFASGSSLSVDYGLPQAEYDFWSSLNPNITELVIPDTITVIPGNAFWNFTNLKAVYIPASVTTISASSNRYPFYGCSSDLVIYCEAASKPSGWGSYWNRYSSSSSLTVKYGWTKAEYDFWGKLNPDIEELIIPDTITTIPSEVCKNFANLTSVTIPASVTSIGSSAFYNCSSLTDVYIEDVAAWLNISFSNSYANPLSANSKTKNLYVNGELLTNLVIPDSVTSINNYAFYTCSSLTSVTIPDSVTSIGSNAFGYCSGLTSIYIPKTVTTISASSYSDSPFYGCSSDLKIYCEVASKPSGWGSYWNNYYGSTYILTTVYGCMQEDYDFWSDLNPSITNLEIPDGITSIPSKALKNFANLKTVDIPDTVTSIGANAFQNCTSLKSIYIPASVTTISAGSHSYSLFYGCASDLKIYCKAASRPSGWDSYWNWYGNNSALSVQYGWTKAEYDFWPNVDSDITELVIPNDITMIPNNACKNFANLTSVTIPDSVRSIGSYAFSGCSSLTNVTIGAGLTSIGKYAFAECTGLERIYIPNNVTTIDGYVFSGCTNVTVYCEAVTTPSGWNFDWRNGGDRWITDIFNCARDDYDYWSTLDKTAESIVIPDGISTIPSEVFQDCTQLKHIYIPASVSSITASYAPFHGCSSSLVIYCAADSKPSGWENGWNIYNSGSYYPYYLTTKYGWTLADFHYWTTLDNTAESIVLPDSITVIDDGAFKGCANLTEITIPDSVTSIGSSAFYGCTGLTEITIPESVTSIGSSAFYGCTGLTEIVIPEGATSIGSSAFYGCTNLTEIMIPESVTYIGPYAFQNCSSLTGIAIPEGVTTIDWSTFSGCTSLAEVIIPQSVTSIESSAFEGCVCLTSVTLPEGIKSIGDSAFSGCTGLTEITIPDSVTSIGSYAFYGCTGLTEIKIPESVTSIGDSAFGGCAGLTDIYFGHMASDELSVDSDAFYLSSSSGYYSVMIHVPTIRDIHTVLEDCYWSSRTVTWVSTDTIPVTEIILTEANDTTEIEAGLELNFTAVLTPADCTSELVWTASNGGIVKTFDYVSGTATIVGMQPGTMTVRCESADDNTVFAEYQVEVLPPTEYVAAISIHSDTEFENEVEVGTTAQMIVEFVPGNVIDRTVVWEVENGTGTAEIDENGLLTALTPGTVTVYATSTATEDGMEVLGVQTIKIVRYVDDLVLLVNGDPTKTTIGVGETVRVTFERFPEDAEAGSVTWRLTNRTGSVKQLENEYSNDVSLYITGVSAGTVNITATANDSRKTSVTVELEVVGERASYSEGITGGKIYYNTVTGAIVDADDSVTTAVIPSKINGTTITSIAPDAFSRRSSWGYYNDNTTLTSVTIPGTVTYIGENAFNSCTALVSLRLGNSVETIGDRAFYDCTSLANLTIPESVTSVGKNAFYNLSSLKNLTIPGELNTRDWLSYNNTLNKVTLTGETIIEPGLDQWGNRRQMPGRNAKTVVISDSVTAIEEYAFSDCTAIETVTMGNNVASIGDYAFEYCRAIETVTMGNNVASIGEEAFSHCYALTTINLPDSLTHIGRNAFESCNDLQLLDIRAVPGAITQQNFPLTDDLVVVPEILVSATDGKAKLRWGADYAHEDGWGNASVHNYSDGRQQLYIHEPGKIELICYDEYTGIQGSKIITCELGLEIDGLRSDYLISGEKVRLTAKRMPEGNSENVKWSLRAEDKKYASLSATSGKYTDLTVKSVSKATSIQVTATSNVAGEAPETRTIWIRPKTVSITVTNQDTGEVLGKTGTTAKTIKWDMRNGSVTLAATVAPLDASSNVYWGTSNYNVAEVDNEGIITPKQPGTTTISARASDGSGKTASFKLQVYYVDPATKLTGKSDAPTYGLEVLDTAQLYVYGTDKQNPLNPADLDYYIPDEQLEMAEIDEETGMLTALKPGTVTVTASIKDDPLARKVVIKVKVIPALTETVFLKTKGSQNSTVVMLDPNGEVTTDPKQAAKYRVYLDKEQMLSGSDTFTVTAFAGDSNGESMTLSATSMKWATTDKRIATVTAGSDGSATVKVNAKIDGACVITATSTDLAKVEGVLEIFVRDYTPRLESTSVTMNSYLMEGIEVGLKPAYGAQIDETVQVLEYIKSSKSYEDTGRFIGSYADGILTINTEDVVSNGTYKLRICTDCTTETDSRMTHELSLSVKVSNKLPTVTLKQSGKFNLFYDNSVAPVTVTVKNETVTDAWIDGTSTASFCKEDFNKDTSVMSVVFTDKYVKGTAGKLDTKMNVVVKLEGYRVTEKKAITLSTTTAKPALSLTPASSIINTARAGAHSTTFRVYNKTDDVYMDVTADDILASFADVSVDQEEKLVKLTLKEGVTVSSKGVSATVTVKDDHWMSPIKLTHKVTVQKSLPTVKFSSATLKLNRVFDQQTATTTVSLSQQNMAIGALAVEPADTKAATRAEAAKIGYEIKGTKIEFRLNEENLPKNGSYTFRVTATLDDGVTKLAAKTFKVTVGSTVPTVKLTTPTLKLNKALGKNYAIAQSAYTVSKGDGYEFVRFDLPVGWSNQDIDVRYDEETGLVTAVLRHDNALTGTKGKHTIALTPVMRDVVTREVAPLPTTVKLTVQVESKTPSVTVTTKGKLDVNLPDSEILYAVKSFTNVSGSPTDVTLEGAHSDLFAADLDKETGKVVTLKLVEGKQYNPKTTYKVTLVFHISGQEVKKSVSFKVAQTSLKLAAIPTLRLYQFQARPMKAKLKVSAPAGAAIDQIELNSKTPYQFRRALGTDNMKVVHLPDGTVEVEFDFEHPGYLTYGKSYTVYLDVTPVSAAVTNKATQIKLTVKSYK